MKKKAAAEIGFHSVDVTLPDQCDEPLILKEIAVEKDADGFSAMNIGNLCLKGGDPPLAVPCTPAGCIELLQRSGYSNLSGLNAVVIGPTPPGTGVMAAATLAHDSKSQSPTIR